MVFFVKRPRKEIGNSRKIVYIVRISPFQVPVGKVGLWSLQVGNVWNKKMSYLWIVGFSYIISIPYVMQLHLVYHVRLPGANPNISYQNILQRDVIAGSNVHG